MRTREASDSVATAGTRPALRVRVVHEPDDVRALLELDRALDRRTAIRVANAEGWVAKNPRALLALEEARGRVWGRAVCAPLTESAFRRMTTSPVDLRELLVADNVLSEDQALRRALDGRGNHCYASVLAADRERGGEDYSVAAPLLRELQSRFYALRLRAMVCHSDTVAQERLIASAGCRRTHANTDVDGRPRTIWTFDFECALAAPTTGLGMILHNLWSAGLQPSSVGLTPAQRRVVFLTSHGYSDHEAARLLAISHATARKHWENVLDRFRARIGAGRRVTRETVVAFCQQHPVELIGTAPGAGAAAQNT
jgi:DNA-binding CsgD family transcriptional regulator